MNKIKTVVAEFIKDEDGLTAVEYAVAGGVVTAGLVAAFGVIGTDASILLNKLKAAIGTAAAG